MSETPGRVEALLVLRLWTEQDGQLRVRISATRDVGGRDVVTSYAATRAEVLATVGAWLDSLVTPR
ncbi:hypothetical protein [Nocardioides taihuensis]|uniref:Uncharacterized protein n=1 Tax=Nocardioides taihuensis TaxID=1835606 RepID=A0ABW0BE94_9ACTN